MRKEPPPCDTEVYNKGETIFVTHTIGSEEIEKWVKKIAKKSGQKVDWFFMGGRAVVKCVGNFDKARKALAELKPEHDQLYLEAVRDLGFKGDTDEEIMRGCPTLDMWWKD